MSLYYCLEGTQAKDTKFIYNDVKNITKESVKLHNSYRSSSSRGINVGATIGYGHKIQTTGNGGDISASKSNQNTTETIYQNGNFQNVNEVHNNTGTMTLSGFNQEGGKVTGNIGKVEVVSRQNTSTTTGSSKGMSVGVSSQGIPTSVNVNASRTNGNRAFVDNQSTFVVGEGSNLHVGTLENTGAVIGKEGNSTFKIDTYAGKDIQNYDTMTTTGGSIGVSLGGKPKITNVGFNQDSRDKQGITRNTVVGDVEITKAEGKPKTGTAYVDNYGVKTIIINGEDPKNATKAGLIGTIVEEGSHVIGKVEGRQRKTGTDEKGLESTGRASNEYFSEKYKDDNPNISIQSDWKDYSNVDFGENVGDYYPQAEERAAKNIQEAAEAFNKLKSQNYILGNDEFLKNLRNYSKDSPYLIGPIISPYFGFYFLPKEIQKKYFGRVEDKDGNVAEGLIMNKFDPKGYEKLINSKEYTIAMHKANLVSLESAYEHFEKNGLKPGTFYVNNKRFSQNFVSQSEIMHLKTRLGIGQAITDADGLNITLREATIVGHIRIIVSEPNKKGEQFVTITRYTRIADEFSEPYNLKWRLPSPFELGNKYGLMSEYEDHDIFKNLRYVGKGKSPEKIKNELKNSMNIGKKNAINNLNKIDAWEYKHYLKNMKERENKKR